MLDNLTIVAFAGELGKDACENIGFAKARFADASAVRAIDRPPADDSLLDLDVREIGGRNAQRIAIE